MIKCSKCGSTAQIKIFKVYINELKYGIVKITIYQCGCGHFFTIKNYLSTKNQ